MPLTWLLTAALIGKMVIFGKLIAQNCDISGYITYVFLNLDYKKGNSKYYMCVRFPNWESPSLKLGDEGYIHLEERRAGIDEWWDGSKFTKYNYDNIQFIKFVPKPKEEDFGKYIID